MRSSCAMFRRIINATMWSDGGGGRWKDDVDEWLPPVPLLLLLFYDFSSLPRKRCGIRLSYPPGELWTKMVIHPVMVDDDYKRLLLDAPEWQRMKFELKQMDPLPFDIHGRGDSSLSVSSISKRQSIQSAQESGIHLSVRWLMSPRLMDLLTDMRVMSGGLAVTDDMPLNSRIFYNELMWNTKREDLRMQKHISGWW